MLQLLAALTSNDDSAGGQLPVRPQPFVCDSTPYAAVTTSIKRSPHSSLAGTLLCSHASACLNSDKIEAVGICIQSRSQFFDEIF